MPHAPHQRYARFQQVGSYLLGATFLLTVVGFAGRLHFLFDVVSNFRLQLLAMALLCALAYGLVRRVDMLAAAVLAAVLNLVAIVAAAPAAEEPATRPPPPSTAQLTVLQWNILVANRDKQEACAEIERIAPDLVFIQEVNGRWMRALNRGLPHYRFLAGRMKPGLAAFARHDRRMRGTEAALRHMPMGRRLRQPYLDVTVPLGERSVRLLNVHAYPPLTERLAHGHEATLEQVADWARHQVDPAAVLGDFNMSRYSAAYGRFVRRSAMQPADRGLLPLLTWAPPWWPLRPLSLPIDHVFVSAGLRVVALEALPFMGSDHRPVLVRLALDGEPGLR